MKSRPMGRVNPFAGKTVVFSIFPSLFALSSLFNVTLNIRFFVYAFYTIILLEYVAKLLCTQSKSIVV